MTEDHVTLIVPAKPEYVRTVRMTASALASRTGMTYEEVEDARAAVDEAFVYAVSGADESDHVTVEFVLADDVFGVEVRLGSGVSEDATQWAEAILGAYCDSHEFVSDAEGQRSLRLALRCRGVDDD